MIDCTQTASKDKFEVGSCVFCAFELGLKCFSTHKLGCFSLPKISMDCSVFGAFPGASLPFRRCSTLQKGVIAPAQVRNLKPWRLRERHVFGRFEGHFIRNHVKFLRETSTICHGPDKKGLAKATSGHPFESEPESSPESTWKSIRVAMDVFYRFSRPHTVIGTAVSIISVSLLAVERLSDFSPLFFTGLCEAIVAALFMNIYIVGLNQLYDIEIDKVNKPYLPLASGEYSVGTGVVIVTSFALMSFWLGWVVGSWPLVWALFVSFVLGTAYSINIPLLRWKRFAFVAAMCILSVRAVIVQLAFFLHIQKFVFGRPAIFTRPLIFATAFMSFFSVVIALFKDIPDIEGDKIFGIHSFSVRLGQKRVFWICVYLLEMAYAVALFVGAASPFLWSKLITVFGHLILASTLWYRAKSVDLNSKVAITSFYMYIWKLFYAEYLLIPLVR